MPRRPISRTSTSVRSRVARAQKLPPPKLHSTVVEDKRKRRHFAKARLYWLMRVPEYVADATFLVETLSKSRNELLVYDPELVLYALLRKSIVADFERRWRVLVADVAVPDPVPCGKHGPDPESEEIVSVVRASQSLPSQPNWIKPSSTLRASPRDTGHRAPAHPFDKLLIYDTFIPSGIEPLTPILALYALRHHARDRDRFHLYDRRAVVRQTNETLKLSKIGSRGEASKRLELTPRDSRIVKAFLGNEDKRGALLALASCFSVLARSVNFDRATLRVRAPLAGAVVFGQHRNQHQLQAEWGNELRSVRQRWVDHLKPMLMPLPRTRPLAERDSQVEAKHVLTWNKAASEQDQDPPRVGLKHSSDRRLGSDEISAFEGEMGEDLEQWARAGHRLGAARPSSKEHAKQPTNGAKSSRKRRVPKTSGKKPPPKRRRR